MKPSEILENAKALLTEETWGQGADRYDKHQICIIDALKKFPLESFALRRVYNLMRVQCAGNVSGWNDAPGRTLVEVHAAFDKAIELAKADGE